MNEAPVSWQGSLNVKKYYMGPELKSGWKVKMDVKTTNQMATVYHTIGILNGQDEPGHYRRHNFNYAQNK